MVRRNGSRPVYVKIDESDMHRKLRVRVDPFDDAVSIVAHHIGSGPERGGRWVTVSMRQPAGGWPLLHPVRRLPGGRKREPLRSKWIDLQGHLSPEGNLSWRQYRTKDERLRRGTAAIVARYGSVIDALLELYFGDLRDTPERPVYRVDGFPTMPCEE